MLIIKDLSVTVENKLVLNNLNLQIESGSFHVLMGPNGSGKSTLAYTLMNHPKYIIKSGTIIFNDININNIAVEQRARSGIFLACQYPQEIPGVKVITFLKEAHRIITNLELDLNNFKKLLYEYLYMVNLDHSFAYRNLNEGFSGGEKKRLEILQMLLLKPKLAILDEIDSGLDIDGIKLIAKAIGFAKSENKEMSVIVITHNPKILNYLNFDAVHIINDGQIIRTGNSELLGIIEGGGYHSMVASSFDPSSL